MNKEKFFEALYNNLEKDYEILKLKNSDYSNSDPFSNFKLVEELGLVSVEQGILTRMTDKMARLVNLINKNNNVKDESITDTMSDLRNYANILQVYYESTRTRETEDKVNKVSEDLPSVQTRFNDFTKKR